MLTENDIPKPSETSSSTNESSVVNPVAGFLGLEDGKFCVRRRDGSVETGWRADELVAGPMGERAQQVIIRKDVYDEDGNIVDTLQKTVSTDQLTEWQESIQSAQPLNPAEQYTKRRLEKLFEPPKVEGGESDGELPSADIELDVDYLFDDDNQKELPVKRTGINIKKKAVRLKEENLQSAEYALRGAMKDPTVASLVELYKGDRYRAKELVQLVRMNAELRMALGTYIVDLLDKGEAGAMPYRITHDDWKTPNHSGYEDLGGKVRSREYVARLVLSMLDGTFDVSRSNADPIEMKYTGDGLGQHRTAAQQVLRKLAE